MARLEIAEWMRCNWFVPLFLIALAIELAFARSSDWSSPRPAEAVIVFDLCITLPVFHALCYFRSLSPKALLIRTAALASLGVYIASKLVPSDAQLILSYLLWAKSLGWVILVLLELYFAVQIVKLVFGGQASALDISTKSGAPQWVVRLMMLEARFWKAVWKLVCRK